MRGAGVARPRLTGTVASPSIIAIVAALRAAGHGDGERRRPAAARSHYLRLATPRQGCARSRAGRAPCVHAHGDARAARRGEHVLLRERAASAEKQRAGNRRRRHQTSGEDRALGPTCPTDRSLSYCRRVADIRSASKRCGSLGCRCPCLTAALARMASPHGRPVSVAGIAATSSAASGSSSTRSRNAFSAASCSRTRRSDFPLS